MLEAFDVVQHERLARTGRQCCDGALEIHPRIRVVCERTRLALECTGIGEILNTPYPAASGAAVFEHDVDGQPVQPRGKFTFTAERAQTCPHTYEDVLRQPLGLLAIRTHTQAHGIDPAHVLFVQDVEFLAGANRWLLVNVGSKRNARARALESASGP